MYTQRPLGQEDQQNLLILLDLRACILIFFNSEYTFSLKKFISFIKQSLTVHTEPCGSIKNKVPSFPRCIETGEFLRPRAKRNLVVSRFWLI